MKRKIIILFIFTLVVCAFYCWYRHHSVQKREERIIEIASQSAFSKEYEKILNFIASEEFKEIWLDKYRNVYYFLQEECPKTTIFMNLNVVLFNSGKNMCKVIFIVDDLDYECGGYKGSMISIFVVNMVNRDGHWSAHMYVDEEIGSFHYGEKVYDIENLISLQQSEEFKLYSKEEKRKYVNSVGIDYFVKVLLKSEKKSLIKDIDFIWEQYWFDKK